MPRTRSCTRAPALIFAAALLALGFTGCCCPPRRCPPAPPTVVWEPGESVTAAPTADRDVGPRADEGSTAPSEDVGAEDVATTDAAAAGDANGDDGPRRFDARAAGVVVRVPAGWKTRYEEDHTFLLEAPLRIPTAGLFEPRRRTMDGAAANLEDELSEGADQIRVTSAPRPGTFAGYPALVAEGTGISDGIQLYWRAWVVDGRRLFIAAVTTPAIMWKLQQSRVQAFVRGVQRRPDQP